MLDALNQWNGRFASARPEDSRLSAQLANYELAFRMQSAAPDLIRIDDETTSIRELYGVDRNQQQSSGVCVYSPGAWQREAYDTSSYSITIGTGMENALLIIKRMLIEQISR